MGNLIIFPNFAPMPINYLPFGKKAGIILNKPNNEPDSRVTMAWYDTRHHTWHRGTIK
jgi:hypothetical protein